MPYIKPRERPFQKMQEFLLGKKLDAKGLSAVLGCAYNTAKLKLEEPGRLTLADIGKINTVGHIPIEEIRDAISK